MLLSVEYELVKSIHDQRLREAEQARLAHMAAAARGKSKRTWSLNFHLMWPGFGKIVGIKGNG